LHQIAHVEVTKRMGLTLFGREIIFEVFQPMWKSYINVTDRRTDRQTDRGLAVTLTSYLNPGVLPVFVAISLLSVL